ncbi:hypothetical protein [Nocardia sp. NBC_00416]|uniref:hypothetical protein n=1 Tax=Nocardia sp. NBC_00416 TaxID=2975991 RepID=UPI002E1CBEAC
MSEELDDISRETAAMMKTMLQIATLVALKARERGQREAEMRVKLTEARAKEARELQIREARDAKAKDPRNLALSQTISRSMGEVRPGTAVPQRENSGYRGVQLEKDRFSISQFAEKSDQVGGAADAVRYDSVERRAALAAHLAKIGVAPELAAARMLVEVGQATPPSEAVRTKPELAPSVQRAREQEQLARGLERSR